jgi:hypothetical protein
VWKTPLLSQICLRNYLPTSCEQNRRSEKAQCGKEIGDAANLLFNTVDSGARGGRESSKQKHVTTKF